MCSLGGDPPLGLFPFGTVTGYRHDFVLSVIVS